MLAPLLLQRPAEGEADRAAALLGALQPQLLLGGGQLYKEGFPGKSILRDHFQENRTSQRPFLLLRISFPARHIFYTIATREDGRKNYGVAIVFYEEVTDTNICHAVHTLQVRVLGFVNVFYKRCKYGGRPDAMRRRLRLTQNLRLRQEPLLFILN